MGLVAYKGILYGGGSDVVANPQDSATDTLETVEIDGTVYEVTDADAVHTSDIGTANGVAELDANGLVPSSQLPSYVDDVLEYASVSAFPATGETGKIYVALDTNLTYRWSGSAYVEISPSLALGETSSTAYCGDRGKTAYDHSQTISGNPHNVTKSEVGLGNVGNFKAVSTVASQGLSDAEKKNARDNIGFDAAVESVAGVDSLQNDGVYLYRQSPANGTRALEAIVGGSVGWNQLCKDGDFADTSEWHTVGGTLTTASNVGSFELTGTISNLGHRIDGYGQYYNFQRLSGHKYISFIDVKTPRAITGARLYPAGSQYKVFSISAINTWVTLACITSETNTSASGMTQFFFGNCASDGFVAGDVIQVRNCHTHDLTALFGTAIADYAYTLETATAGTGIAWLKNQGYFTEDYYAYDSGSVQSVVVDRKEIRNSDDEIVQTITYDHSKTLRGIPKLVNNSIQYDGDVYRSDGGGSVKYKLKTIAESDISEAQGYTNVKYYRIQKPLDMYSRGAYKTVEIVNDAGFIKNARENAWDYADMIGCYTAQANIDYIWFGFAVGTTLAQAKAVLTDKTIQYPLATPTTLSATPFTNPQKTAVGGTEEFVDYAKEQGTRDVAVPVGHNTQYKKLPAEWDDDYMLYLQDKAENALQTGWHDSFAQLSDTSFSNLANGQIPKWNSTSGKWENANESGGGGASSLAELSDTNISSPADGQILKWDGTTSKWVNATEYSYSLPTASASTKGGIKVGDNLSMNGEVLSAKTVPWTKIWNYRSGTSPATIPSGTTEIMLAIVYTYDTIDYAESVTYPFNSGYNYNLGYYESYSSKWMAAAIRGDGSFPRFIYTDGSSIPSYYDFEVWAR